MLLKKKGIGVQKPPSVNLFYPSNDSCNLNRLLNDMDKDDTKNTQKEADMPNVASPLANTANDAPIVETTKPVATASY